MPSKAELFLLRDAAGPILYAPLRNVSVRLNEAAVDTVARRMKGEPPLQDDMDVLRILDEHHVFEPAPVPESHPEKPTHVTLFPTDGCNLRCRYCYAGAEKARHVMPVQAGKAAVDLVIENALAQDAKEIEVSFHGNGEPFTAFSVVREVGEYAVQAAEARGLICHLLATSNGVMSDEVLDWVLAWIEDITISFDGLEALQNRQRPMADGSGSFPHTDRTLRRLNDSGKAFSIRTTITGGSVDDIVPLALEVASRYPACRLLHIEPSWESGRSLVTGMHSPDPEAFAARFLEADALLKGKMELVYSADRADYIDNVFCSAARNGFTVTAEGYVTACYELCEPSLSGSERFIYGKWTPELGFVFDEEKLKRLHELTVDNMSYCNDCFCKYSCCGDCPAKLLGGREPGDHRGSPRCRITRAITLARIGQNLEGDGDHGE